MIRNRTKTRATLISQRLKRLSESESTAAKRNVNDKMPDQNCKGKVPKVSCKSPNAESKSPLKVAECAVEKEIMRRMNPTSSNAPKNETAAKNKGDSNGKGKAYNNLNCKMHAPTSGDSGGKKLGEEQAEGKWGHDAKKRKCNGAQVANASSQRGQTPRVTKLEVFHIGGDSDAEQAELHSDYQHNDVSDNLLRVNEQTIWDGL